MSIYCSCISCKKLFSARGINIHFDRTHGTDEQKLKYSNGYNGHYSDLEYRKKLSNNHKSGYSHIQHYKRLLTKVCPKCKTLHEKPGTFCSHSCAYSKKDRKDLWTEDRRRKQSIYGKEVWKRPEYRQKLISYISNNKNFTSKNEILIRDYFIQTFPDDGWTFGGHIACENFSISRDLYSNKLKVCIEYDGIWHFKDIKNQLKNKQEKDMALENWCLLNNFRLIRIDEDIFKTDPDYYLNYLVNLAYNSKESVIKQGVRY